MNPRLFLLFNHRITPLQEKDAKNSLRVSKILAPPERLIRLWRRIPPELAEIEPYLRPIVEWLKANAVRGDFVLIQGDFGACCIMVRFAFEMGYIPIYSTTEREAAETHGKDGSVTLTHRFEHRMFRRYGD